MGWWNRLVGRLRGDGVASGRQAPGETIATTCETWAEVVDLLGAGAAGLQVPAGVHAEPGQRLQLEVRLPDGSVLELPATVAAIVDEEAARRAGRRPGLTLQLGGTDPLALARLTQVLETARAAARVPAAVPDPPGASTPRDQPPSLPSPTEPSHLAPAVITYRAVVGIDLGTSYTSVAAVLGRRVAVLARPGTAPAFPSVLAFTADGGRLVGDAARARLAIDPARTIASPKRLLGRRFDDPEIQPFLAGAPYRTVRGPDDAVLAEIWGEPIPITLACSWLLAEARAVAEDVLDEPVKRVVLTVPVSFDERRLRILRRAAELARLEVVATIDEPSAAALANRFDRSFGGTVGVYDFGGGTFDFSIVDTAGGAFRVLGTAGDSWLGGDDFDLAIAEVAANRFWKQHGVDLRRQAVEWQQLLFACERAKRALTTETSAMISVPAIVQRPGGAIDLGYRIDRAMLETVCTPVIERSLATCVEALEMVDLAPGDLASIFLSGGTTRIPAVRAALERRLGVPVRTGVPPDLAVCLGAGIHAAQIQLGAATTLEAVG